MPGVYAVRRSKRLTQRDVQRGAPLEAPGDHFRVGLEAQVHADRPNWRSVTHTEANGAPKIPQTNVARAPEHVADVQEPDRAERPADQRAQLGVEDHDSVAAERKSVLVDRFRRPERIECKAADCCIAAPIEPFAGWQIINALRSRILRSDP